MTQSTNGARWEEQLENESGKDAFRESHSIGNLRVFEWLDKNRGKVFYGIDVKIGFDWYHLRAEDRSLFFLNKSEAIDKMKELRKTGFEFSAVPIMCKNPKGKTLSITSKL